MKAPMTEKSPLVRKEAPLISCANQVFLITCTVAIAEGYHIGIINGVMQPLQKDFHLSTANLAVLLGVPNLVAAIACFFAGSLLDTIGRKWTMALAMALISTASVGMATATSFMALLCFRNVIFVGIGTGLTASTTYLAESAPSKKRGLYLSLTDLLINAGLVASTVVAAALAGKPDDWRLMLGMGAIIPTIATALIFAGFMPESPRYLLLKGRRQEAERMLAELLDGDMEDISKVLRGWDTTEDETPMSWPEAAHAFTTTHSRPFIAGCGAGLFMVLSCQSMIANIFCTAILSADGSMPISQALQMSIVVSIAKFLIIIGTAFYAIDHIGRRPLLQASSLLGTVGSLLLSITSFYALSDAWMVFGTCIMAGAFSIGFGPVSFSYIGEVFETKIRAKGTATCFVVSRIAQAVVAGALTTAIQEMDQSKMFLFIAMFNLLSLYFVSTYCPETKNKTLEQLKDMFNLESKKIVDHP
eukprot:TRINITY_DN49785_c0_g1_i1.p1 TRINITY_DN49785_c0_g1~~TRINITY_DN49785_c0_g1_i1.p1  ORF type:complete len:474 (+),score=60.10 TRINITY_DN49785_c0_g1_i1:111-1532(+)